MIVYLVATKLDFSSKREREKHLLTSKEKPTFQKMIDFLEVHCKYLHRVTIDKPDSNSGTSNKRVPTKNSNVKSLERLTSHSTTKNVSALSRFSCALQL